MWQGIKYCSEPELGPGEGKHSPAPSGGGRSSRGSRACSEGAGRWAESEGYVHIDTGAGAGAGQRAGRGQSCSASAWQPAASRALTLTTFSMFYEMKVCVVYSCNFSWSLCTGKSLIFLVSAFLAWEAIIIYFQKGEINSVLGGT